MLLALAAAVGASVAFGVAAVLQAVGTARTPSGSGLDPLLLVRLLRQPAFLGALALDAAGFSLHIVALRALPLFLVQAVVAASVAVTALLAVRVMSLPLSRQQWVAIVCVCVGLAVLAPSAETVPHTPGGASLRVVLLLTAALAAAGGVLAGRPGGTASSVALGLLGGVEFGVVAVAVRLLPSRWLDIPGDLSAYVLVLAGTAAFLLYSTAMQRGNVTTATTALVVTQTGVPAVLGIALLGDRVRPGWGVPAAIGFALALAAAVVLARADRVSA